MLKLDHLAVSAANLDEGRANVEDLFGVSLQPGGQHAHFGTHNLLLGLEDDLYLEVIAIDPDAPKPVWPRWFDLDRFEGPPRLTTWICRSDDLEGDLERAYDDPVAPLNLARGDLRWRMGIPKDGTTPFDNLFPPMIDWMGGTGAAARLPASGCRMTQLVVQHPDARAMQGRLSGLLDDTRVRIQAAEAPAILAVMETPNGEVILG